MTPQEFCFDDSVSPDRQKPPTSIQQITEAMAGVETKLSTERDEFLRMVKVSGIIAREKLLLDDRDDLAMFSDKLRVCLENPMGNELETRKVAERLLRTQ